MAINLETKQEIVQQVHHLAQTSVSVGVADYGGLTVAQLTELRQLARGNQVVLQVVKNTLARRAFKDTDCACVEPVLKGQVILGFAEHHPGAVANIFRQFIQENEQLQVRGLGVNGQFLPSAKLEQVAQLPNKDQAISQLMALMLAPVSKLVRTLNEFPSRITRIISQISNQKQP